MHLHFESVGQGEPLVILHGLFGSSDNWRFHSRRFRERFQVFALDLRNHGRSPHSVEMNYHVLAEDVHEFQQTHHLRQVNLLGHSMGGKAAMMFALRCPERVRKLVVVDMAPRAYSPFHTELLEALLALDLSKYETRGQVEEVLAHAIPEKPVRQFLLKSLTREGHGPFRWKINLPAISENYPRLSEALPMACPFDKPALFIRGEQSKYVRDKDWELIHELFPQAEMHTIARAGHWVHAEAPEEFLTVVQAFLAEEECGRLSVPLPTKATG